jgi:nitrite reductase (NADH) large subunit
MQTSDPNIFAAGDVAEHDGIVRGLWPTAVEQAKVAATNATGGDLRYAAISPATTLKVTGVDLTCVGRFEPESEEETVIALEDPFESRYRKLVVAPDGTIAGAILLGYAIESVGIVDAVKNGRDVSSLLDDLAAGDWSAFDESAEARRLTRTT